MSSHPLTVGQLFRQLEQFKNRFDIEDIEQFEIWIEDTTRYGAIDDPDGDDRISIQLFAYDEQDYLITSVCTGIDSVNKRILINHHI